MAHSRELCRREINTIRIATELGHPTNQVYCLNRNRCDMDPDTCVVARQEGRLIYLRQDGNPNPSVPSGSQRFYRRLAKTVDIRGIQIAE
jgi:hypothetical protein